MVARSPDQNTVPMAIAELTDSALEDLAVMMASVTRSIMPLTALYILDRRWFVE